MLSLLPPPPQDKTGWPWTEESDPVPLLRKDGTKWPKLSFVTPSYNQGNFLEETIRSVLLQNYPLLEYVIIDGGSSDSTFDVIKKYEKWITFWVSESDKGQSDAINKGLKRCSGELVNWICSDDLLCKNALNIFASQYYLGSRNLYIGKCLLIDAGGKITGMTSSSISSFEELIDLKNKWRKDNSIAQPATLYPLDAINSIGGLKINNHYAMDYELWGELLINNTPIINIPLEIGIFRWHTGQKTANDLKSTRDLVRSAISLVNRNSHLSFIEKVKFRYRISGYYLSFIYHKFRSIIGIKRRFRKLLKSGIQDL